MISLGPISYEIYLIYIEISHKKPTDAHIYCHDRFINTV